MGRRLSKDMESVLQRADGMWAAGPLRTLHALKRRGLVRRVAAVRWSTSAGFAFLTDEGRLAALALSPTAGEGGEDAP